MFNSKTGVSNKSWKKHIIRQYDGLRKQIEISAEFQIVNEPEINLQAPVMTHMPEKDRLIILATECIISQKDEGIKPNIIYNATMFTSDDLGNSWNYRYPVLDDKGNPVIHWADSLEYLGEGHVIFHSSDANALGTGESSLIWSSSDYGCTWDEHLSFPKENNGKELYLWGDGIANVKDPNMEGNGYIIASGYHSAEFYPVEKSHAGIRFSFDSGKTWSGTYMVPEWYGFNEVSIIQAANGDLVAAVRSDMPKRFNKSWDDNYSGMGTSFSTDGGFSWSKVEVIYEWGRHFPSMVLLENGDIVMTYVVRRGYTETEDGYPQFGIEAVVSHDHGRTWDMDHRYILADWQGKSKGPFSWLYGCQNTSTVLLHDGSLLTTFSFGPESNPDPTLPKGGAKYNIGLVRWKLNHQRVSEDRTMAISPFDSDIRNKVYNRPQDWSLENWRKFNGNIAISEAGALVRSSICDYDPSSILYDRFTRTFLTLETIPAWVEITWPEEHSINEIHIHPGAPSLVKKPETDCIPIDYRLQYLKNGEWHDIIAPVFNSSCYDRTEHFTCSNNEFESIHKFMLLTVKSIRIYITKSSDSGKRRIFGDNVIIPPAKRKTVLRWIEVIESR